MVGAEAPENAQIISTFLGIEDHGIFVAGVTLDYGISQQGFHRALDEDSAYGALRDILAAVGVDSWEALAGRYCRVRRSGGLIRQIGHITRDKWTDFEWDV